MMGRRSRRQPEEVTIDGFLLLDTGEYELVTAHIPLDVFWKMKVLDVVGHVRTANRARVARPDTYPQVGSVWLVDAELEAPATGSISNDANARAHRADGLIEMLPFEDGIPLGTPGPEDSLAHDPAEKVFRMRVYAVHTLDRVALEPDGPRVIETLHVRDMLPEFRAD
jgi:hypothetical protein